MDTLVKQIFLYIGWTIAAIITGVFGYWAKALKKQFEEITDMNRSIKSLEKRLTEIENGVKVLAKSSEKLLEMHERPDSFGFGTIRLNTSIDELTKGISEFNFKLDLIYKLLERTIRLNGRNGK